MQEKEIGFVSNFFSKISVAAVEITGGKIAVGDNLHFKGATTDFTAKLNSMQIEHESVSNAKKGDSVGIKISEKVRKLDKVHKVLED